MPGKGTLYHITSKSIAKCVHFTDITIYLHMSVLLLAGGLTGQFFVFLRLQRIGVIQSFQAALLSSGQFSRFLFLYTIHHVIFVLDNFWQSQLHETQIPNDCFFVLMRLLQWLFYRLSSFIRHFQFCTESQQVGRYSMQAGTR